MQLTNILKPMAINNTHLPSWLFTGRFLVWETWNASPISVESQWLKEKTSFNLVPIGNQTDKLLTGFYHCNSRIDNDVHQEKIPNNILALPLIQPDFDNHQAQSTFNYDMNAP